MKIELVERNYVASDHLKGILSVKLAKLDKYFDEEGVSAKVSLKKEGGSVTTEVMLSYAGKLVRAVATGDTAYENIDKVLPKLEGQIRKHRTKFDKHSKNNAFKDQAIYAVNDLPDVKQKTVVKEKHFKLSPMTMEDAISDMEMLGHSFYVYKDLKSNTVKIIYLRNDGDYGLIEPEE